MRAAALALAALALVACKQDKDAPSSKKLDDPDKLAMPTSPVPAGSLVRPPFHADYAVLVPATTAPELGVAAVREAAKARGLAVRDVGVQMPSGRGVLVGVDAPGDADVWLAELEHTSVGLTSDELAQVRATKHVVRIGAFAGDDAPRNLRDAMALARAAAAATKGWIYDAAVFRTYGRAAFDEHFPEPAPMQAPLVTRFRFDRAADGSFSMRSMGLQRLGLPELVLHGVPGNVTEDMNLLLNIAAQTLIDRGALAKDGELAVDLAALREPWPELGRSFQANGGTGAMTWTATWETAPSALDAARTIELSVPGEGPAAERLFAAVRTMAGDMPGDLARPAEDDAEMLAARDRARQELARLEKAFAKGIPPGEQLVVKAPFATDDGNVEWMWVDVQAWNGPTMTGILLNKPNHVAKLRVGARVEVKVAELYDYLHTLADGTEAGGETNRILEARSRTQ